MLRRALLTLVFAQFILLVAFAVLVGGYALAAATSDTSGASVLWWTAMSCLMLIAIDVLLLVGVLGISALVISETRDRPEV
jgi:heme/copper-type cytochrome/quinol oxidase subunit 2